MIAAYRVRREQDVRLARAAAVATPESFDTVMAGAFPPLAVPAPAADMVTEQWWGA